MDGSYCDKRKSIMLFPCPCFLNFGKTSNQFIYESWKKNQQHSIYICMIKILIKFLERQKPEKIKIPENPLKSRLPSIFMSE